MINGAALHLFRRHVSNSTHHFAGISIDSARRNTGLRDLCVDRAGEFGQAKVQDLHATIVRYEQIIRFQIAVDDTLLMRCCKTA